VWNLRYPGFTEFEGMILWAARNTGPVAVPGSYEVRLTADGVTRSREFEVRVDPRVEGRVSDANEAVIRIRRVEEQIEDRLREADDNVVHETADRARERLDEVESTIYQVRNRSNQDPLNFPIRLNNKLASLMFLVESAESRPTDQSYEVFEELSAELEAELQALDVILREDVGRLNALLRERGLEPVEIEAPVTD